LKAIEQPQLQAGVVYQVRRFSTHTCVAWHFISSGNFEKQFLEKPLKSTGKNLKTQQSPIIFDLCLRETRAGKSHDYHDVIGFGKLRFKNVFRPY